MKQTIAPLVVLSIAGCTLSGTSTVGANVSSGAPPASSACAPATPVPGKSHTPMNAAQTVPGQVSVIFDLAYHVQLDAAKRSVTSADCTLQAAVNAILAKYGLVSAIDATSGGQFPSDQNRSIIWFQFPPTADTQAISRELFALPGVTDAYPSVISQPG